ncbi:hypothetical protein P389DRAFT_86628 [Cystobasidium minutum MCA 4210]|uniref:uncharacterized protein n=1 Tax=Cystobasidium minutum MCA 4210 TaxID=1397322 RepID=UPI0034CD1D4D|eukprot:jgi/Rhomi1/86628/CE86627_223
MLVTSLGLLSVAVGTALAATVPQPSRMDVVKRARQRGSVVRRQGPSAVPEPPIAQCGSMPVGETFLLRGYMPARDTYYYASLDDSTAYGTYMTLADNWMNATPYYFDIECNLNRVDSNQEMFFLAQGGSSVIQVGNEAFRDTQGATNVANCAITDGILTCGTPSIPAGQFCNMGSPLVYFADANAMLACRNGAVEFRPFVNFD